MNTFPRDPTSPAHLDERLDEALDESFPASDSPAVSLGDEPPAQSRFGPEEGEGVTGTEGRKGLFTKILTGGALAAAGIVVTRMLLRRSARGRRN